MQTDKYVEGWILHINPRDSSKVFSLSSLVDSRVGNIQQLHPATVQQIEEIYTRAKENTECEELKREFPGFEPCN